MHVDEGDATDKNMHGANHNLYTLVRQVPPGRQHFFFTWRSDTTMLKIQERDKVGSRRNRALFIGAHCFYLLLSNVFELRLMQDFIKKNAAASGQHVESSESDDDDVSVPAVVESAHKTMLLTTQPDLL